MSDLYEIIKDDQGREIAYPKQNTAVRRALTWDRKMEKMGRSKPLRGLEKLNAYQTKIFRALIDGEKDAILFGTAGAGKTTVALHALRALHMLGISVMAWRFAQFKTKMEPGYLDENKVSPYTVLEEHTTPKILLLDDLGYGGTQIKPSEHEQRIFFDLVNAREGSGRQTWIITNMSRANLYHGYGNAAISRLEVSGNTVVGDFTKKTNYRFH